MKPYRVSNSKSILDYTWALYTFSLASKSRYIVDQHDGDAADVQYGDILYSIEG